MSRLRSSRCPQSWGRPACRTLGAASSEVRADLWRWRAGSWRLAPDIGPDRRTFPAMAYDSTRDEVVLFGGSRVLFGDSASPPAMLGDTWRYLGVG